MGTRNTPRDADRPPRPAGAGRARRQVLRLGAAATLAAGGTLVGTLGGCDLIRPDEPAPVPAVDPLTPLRDDALRLAAGYDRAAAARPGLAGRLRPLAAAHRAHAAELSRVLQPPNSPAAEESSAPPAPPAGDDDAVLARLRTTEQQAQRTAAAACRQAPAGRAALLGSIAAARASHVEALR